MMKKDYTDDLCLHVREMWEAINKISCDYLPEYLYSQGKLHAEDLHISGVKM